MKNPNTMKPRTAYRIFAALAIVGLAVMLLGFQAGRKTLSMVGCVAVCVGLAVHFIFYRCPSCGKYLGRVSVRGRCPHCGEKIEDEP